MRRARSAERCSGDWAAPSGGRSNIFLDEVGDLPAETSIALLRVLQEPEFKRVRGNQPIRADGRVIAVTHRHLQTALAEEGAALGCHNTSASAYQRFNCAPVLKVRGSRGLDPPREFCGRVLSVGQQICVLRERD